MSDINTEWENTMNEMQENKSFIELCNINVDKIASKNYKNINYISWANAYKLAMEYDQNFKYEIIKFNDKPYFYDDLIDGFFVEVICTMNGSSKSMLLPVLNNSHKPVKKSTVDSFMINSSLQRCLVKCIALFGIGISMYLKEDFYEEDKNDSKNTITAQQKAQQSLEWVQSYYHIILEKGDNALTDKQKDVIPKAIKKNIPNKEFHTYEDMLIALHVYYSNIAGLEPVLVNKEPNINPTEDYPDEMFNDIKNKKEV